MVGRLVQQHQVRTAKQHFGKFDTHLPAAAEFVGQALHIRSLKTEATQHFFGIGFARGAAHVVQVFGDITHLFNEFVVLI